MLVNFSRVAFGVIRLWATLGDLEIGALHYGVRSVGAAGPFSDMREKELREEMGVNRTGSRCSDIMQSRLALRRTHKRPRRTCNFL